MTWGKRVGEQRPSVPTKTIQKHLPAYSDSKSIHSLIDAENFLSSSHHTLRLHRYTTHHIPHLVPRTSTIRPDITLLRISYIVGLSAFVRSTTDISSKHPTSRDYSPHDQQQQLKRVQPVVILESSQTYTSKANMAAAATVSAAPGLMTRSAMAGSSSQTQTQAPPQVLVRAPVLRLRGAETSKRTKKRIQWAEDVIDNEGLGRKSSKGMLSLPW